MTARDLDEVDVALCRLVVWLKDKGLKDRDVIEVIEERAPLAVELVEIGDYELEALH